jgi:Dyp-type peroxidase family
MPITTSLNLTNIQGNSIGGFNKDNQCNLFLRFKDKAAGRAWIKEISDEVAKSSSADVVKFNNKFSFLKARSISKPEAIISSLWVNLALSFQGLKALKVKDGDLNAFPEAFRVGMANRPIGDEKESDPSKWIPPFKNSSDVHAVLIVAADDSHELQRKVADITSTPAFKAGVDLLLNQPGMTRPDLPGHEHFGFKDGISQPGIRGVDMPDDPIGDPNQGHPGQDLLWPGEFIIGYATQSPVGKNGSDELNTDPNKDSASGPAWTDDGSYLVFRRLRQDVAGFEKNVATLANELGWSVELTGAKLVGRYKSGAPIEQQRSQSGPYTPPSTDPGDPIFGNPALGDSNALNNNFEFGGDPRGAICPMSGHIRKAYPRDEDTGYLGKENHTQTHRLLRRGIPYGAPYVPHDPCSADEDRGLLFLCYQNDIEEHFEFVQKCFVNKADFPPGEPGSPGEDPIIAQSPMAKMRIDPEREPVDIKHFVTTTGGEYFFSPSISALRGIGSGSI